MARISLASVQSEMLLPLIPPQVKFQPILECFDHFDQFWPISGGMEILAGTGFDFFFKKKNSYPIATLFYISNQMFIDPFTHVKLQFWQDLKL